MAEERINELEDRSTEITNLKNRKKKNEEKVNGASETSGTTSGYNGSPRREEREMDRKKFFLKIQWHKISKI